MKGPLLKMYALVALVVGLSTMSFAGGLYVGDSSSETVNAVDVVNFDSSVDGIDFDLFWEVWSLLDEKYVPSTVGTTTEEITSAEKLYGAIEGLTSSYGDPYTVFLPPQEAKTFEEDVQGNFGGVGIEIGMQDGLLTVISPLKDTPAYKAGVLAGDVILEVDGTPTATVSIDEAIDLIRGEKGTQVVLTIGREGQDPIDIPVTRDRIDIPAIDTEIRDDVFIINLYNFSAVSVGQFREALREFVKAGTDKMIIDVRGNPGGYLEAAIDMTSWFLPEGQVVVREEFGEGREGFAYRSKGYNIFTDKLKLAILINGGSASASEILAGALQDQREATLIGTNTFGKGSVQELVSLEGGTSLKVTIARWLTPNGVSISDGGLAPDIEVEMTVEDIQNGNDPQLEKAIEHLNSL